MNKDERVKGPGIKYRERRNGPPVPYWFPDKKATKAGYPVKSANLSTYADRPALMLERAQRLQQEMLKWLDHPTRRTPQFDGTFRSLLLLYETDKESNFNTTLKPGVRETYLVYIKRLIRHIGDLRIERHDGRDLKRWFKLWRTNPDGSDHLPRAKMVLAVLKAAITFGITCRYKGCLEFQRVVEQIEFPAPKARTFAPTAVQIVAAREAAHAAGAPCRALLYALTFETTGRYFDFFGEWLPLSDKKPSAVLAYGKKWVGPHWSAVDDKLMMKIKPTKTEDSTAVEVPFDLSACPMVMEELARFPAETRKGPVIINETTGLPYVYETFRLAWREDFKAAGMPEGMWCRDLRAGGITEGGKAGASKDDRQKIAGHSKPKQTEKYDRDQVEAFRRTMKSRTNYRAKNEA